MDVDETRVGHKTIKSGILSFSLVSIAFGGHPTPLFDDFGSISLVSTAFGMQHKVLGSQHDVSTSAVLRNTCSAHVKPNVL